MLAAEDGMRAWSRRKRNWIWYALSDLLEANLVAELARLEAGASPLWEAVRKYELERARAEELRFEVTATGTATKRAVSAIEVWVVGRFGIDRALRISRSG
jgi:hypothetical protein